MAVAVTASVTTFINRVITNIFWTLQHDVDHGDNSKIKGKQKKIGDVPQVFRHQGAQLLDAARFVHVQANLLSAIELALTNSAIP